MVAGSEISSLVAMIRSELVHGRAFGDEESLGALVALAVLERTGGKFKTLQDLVDAVNRVSVPDSDSTTPAPARKIPPTPTPARF